MPKLTTILRILARPLLDHWLGRHHWLFTLLVTIVAVTYALSYVINAIVINQIPFSRPGVGIAIWLCVGSAVLVWQAVGAYRGSSHSATPPADVCGVWGGYVAIATAICIMVLNVVDGISARIPPATPNTASISNTFDVSYDADHSAILLRGTIDYGAVTATANLLARQRKTKALILDSHGGLIFAARSLAKVVLAHELDTHVDGRCFSACTIVFMAGTRRTLTDQSQLGFHRYAFTSAFAVQTVDAAKQQRIDMAFFAGRGVSQDFLARMFQSSHDRLWMPDHGTLRAASVLVGDPQ